MVRYIGAPVAPADLLTAPPHSLYVQSYKPREMTSGVVNAARFREVPGGHLAVARRESEPRVEALS